MKLYRYMSKAEFFSIRQKYHMVNNDNHVGSRTSSTGFCFLGEQTVFETDEGTERCFSPEECILFLSGIVSNDRILVEFEYSGDDIQEGYGIYADPFSWDWYACIEIEEYSMKEYDVSTCVPKRYKIVEDYFDDKNEWQPFTYINEITHLTYAIGEVITLTI